MLFVTHSIHEAAYLGQRVLMMAANPGRVRAIVPVDLPADRTLATRETPEFVALTERAAPVAGDVLMSRRPSRTGRTAPLAPPDLDDEEARWTAKHSAASGGAAA